MPSTKPSFRPPFCPNPDCDFHLDPDAWRYVKKGFFARDHAPRRVQRYRCSQCHRNFSSQTFSPTYWLKRPELFTRLLMRLVACSGFRQIARESGVSKSTVQRQTERLGRHCLLFHERHRPLRPEPSLVLDGLRSFEHSQYWPLDLNLLVGRSHFVYGFSDAPLRRSGTMTPKQKHKRALLERRLGRPDPRATEKSVRELLGRIVPKGHPVELATDEHRAYPRSLGPLRDRRIHHRTTSSKAARTPANPLFPANQADHLIRHSHANHKRETIAFSKRRQSALYRLAIHVVWRNYVKHTAESRRDGPPAKALGLIRRALSGDDILNARLFPSRASISGWLEQCYFARIQTTAIPTNRTHALKFAM